MRAAAIPALLVAAAAGAAGAQTIPSANELRLNAQREALAPTLRLLDRQDANMRLRAYSSEELREVDEQTRRVLSQTGTSCDIVEAVRVGQTVRRRDLFEVACANGYGYILMNGATPAAYDCWTLARIGLALRRENPRSIIGTQCGLERNVGDMSDQLLARANTAR